MRRSSIMTTAILTAAILGWSSTAQAQNAVGIGGKTSLSLIAAINTTNPDIGTETTTLLIGGNAGVTTPNGRFEYGGGLTVAGTFSDNIDIAFWTFTGQGRINTNALGPEENVILFGGLSAGVTLITGDFEDELGVIGPKIGAEYYISPNAAIQLQDDLLFDSDGGVTNNLTIGFKVLFN